MADGIFPFAIELMDADIWGQAYFNVIFIENLCHNVRHLLLEIIFTRIPLRTQVESHSLLISWFHCCPVFKKTDDWNDNKS